MGVLGRTWAGLAALGAGLVHLGIAAGSPVALLVPLTALGAIEVGWGTAALARVRVPVPALALGGALLGPAGWALTLALGAHGTLPVAALGGASALDLAVAAGLAARRRWPLRRDRPLGPWRYLAGVVTGAAVVAAVTTASLGASPIGAGAMSGMHM